MGKQIRGSHTRLVGYTESAFDTQPGAPSGLVLPFVSDGTKPNESRDTDETITGYRGEGRSVAGNQDLSGQIQLNMAPQTVGWWLTHLVGQPTTTDNGDGTYTHVFKAATDGANALPAGFELERDYGSGMTAASRYLVMRGCRINQGKFDFAASGFAKLALDIMGASSAKASAAMDATPTDNGHSAFALRNAGTSVTLKSGGSAVALSIVTLSLTWANNLDGDTYVIGSGGIRGDLAEGKASVSGSIDTLFKDANLQDLQLDDSDASITQVLQAGTGNGSAGNEKLTIDIPSIVFAQDAATVSGPKGLRLTGNFTAHRTTGELAATFTLLSPIAAF